MRMENVFEIRTSFHSDMDESKKHYFHELFQSPHFLRSTWTKEARNPQVSAFWPPRSPDFNLIGLYSWVHRKDSLCCSAANTPDGVWRRVWYTINSVRHTHDVYRRVSVLMQIYMLTVFRSSICLELDDKYNNNIHNVLDVFITPFIPRDPNLQ
jgi:hypothetical protein